MGGQESKVSDVADTKVAKAVDKIINDNPVTIFSTTVCPYCTTAKNTFESLGTKYKSFELNTIIEGREMMDRVVQKTDGQRTVNIKYDFYVVNCMKYILMFEYVVTRFLKSSDVDNGLGDVLNWPRVLRLESLIPW